MDFRQLELFLAVMDCSGITRAAEKVHLSPGAVSLQLHNLAIELRTELFVRVGKNLRPTPAAARLADHARAVLRQVRQIEQEFENDPATDTRPLHFATGATALIHSLVKPLRRVRKEFPRTTINITVAATEEMVQGLLDRHYDLALISLPFPSEALEIMPLYDEELLILRPAPNRVTRWHVGDIDVAELERAQFILYPERSNMRSMIDVFFRDLGIAPRVVTEADDTEVMKKLVESGFGYSILPEYALHGQPRFFRTFRVEGHRMVRLQALAMVRSAYPRALTVQIARLLQSALTSRGAASGAGNPS
jgi:DNA-binding transcriptional LysR family regulator